MHKRITIKDMAHQLNVSVSTVSKALNNDPSIGHFTRERVQQLATEWNYVPNEAARHFQQRKSFTVGLLIPNLLDQFYVQAINGVDAVATPEKYRVLISQTYEEVARENAILHLMLRDRVDGVIAAITKNTTDMAPFRTLELAGIPVVYIARTPKNLVCVSVTSNNYEGAFKATQFLIERGHQRIAHLKGPETMATSQARYAGYRQALVTYGLPDDPSLVKTVDLSSQSTYTATHELMQLRHPPTGILTFKNYVTLDAMAYLKNTDPAKLTIIDFVGFGNLPLVAYLDHKPAASVDENSFEMGTQAMRCLLQMMDNSTRTIHSIEIPCRLVQH